ncbi:hypothetical protein G9274_000027 [Stenotrophomonas rhizophila]|nr:hypothetical protein G9274_000027 [Stenotrophomonas rhizophila]
MLQEQSSITRGSSRYRHVPVFMNVFLARWAPSAADARCVWMDLWRHHLMTYSQYQVPSLLARHRSACSTRGDAAL